MAIGKSGAVKTAKSELRPCLCLFILPGPDKLCTRIKPEIKRQRTGSRSPSGSPVLESEDESTKASLQKQKPRGAAARSQREKEQRDKDRERDRSEAANRRKGRAERRKGDGKLVEGYG